MAYNVLPQNQLYRGKPYCSWIEDWFNWFLSVEPDRHNSGPVVFLKSFGGPGSARAAATLDGTVINLGSDTTERVAQARTYMNNPNLMVGGHRLQIFLDQVILLPIINAYWVATEPYADQAYMQSYTSAVIDHGDNPPLVEQVTVDGLPIQLPPDSAMQDFRLLTSVFSAMIPDSGYGTSVRDMLEMPLPAGHYPAVVEGYFMLIAFEEAATYIVQSRARGPRDQYGHYVADLLYEIEVFPLDRRTPCGQPTFTPARNAQLISRMLQEKESKGELSAADVARYKRLAKI